jgi:hypothetical protein
MAQRIINFVRPRRGVYAAMVAYCLLVPDGAAAQQSAVDPASPAPVAGDSPDGIAQAQARLGERYDRLELLVGRLAELSRGTQARRATLLREMIARSRDRDVAGQFDRVVAALDDESYSQAIEQQTALHTELEKLLELLLQEDRDRQLDSERKRIGRYLQDLNRLIRLERGVKARTDGGDEQDVLADDQQRIDEQTGKLGEQIETTEGVAEAKAQREAEQRAAESTPDGGQPKATDSPPNEPNGKPNEEKPGQGKPSEGGEPSEGKPSEGPPSGEQPSEGQPSKGQPSEGQPSEGQPSQGQPGGGRPGRPQPPNPDADQQPPQDQSTPMERTAERLRKAQERMKEAQKRLEESQRLGAIKEQEQAIEELEQAKAELERILRQLREEELERMLVLLEARFRKMLDDQVEVYEETKRVDAAAAKTAPHELEIAGGRLSRREALIVREADRALVLLREDGTSVAFPEAIEQARDDMQSIADRLRDAKFALLTQGLEEDVIAALEETLAALQQAIKDLRQQRAQQQQGGGPPGEQPLVDQLAELRMIRSLQVRVNNRTKRYGDMIDGEQALKRELLEALDELSLRQQKILQATHDLDTKANQ